MEKSEKRKELETMYSPLYVDATYGVEWGYVRDEYVCKKCGARFRKPEDLNAYKGHILKCKSKSKH